jgi:hypothetical protein
MLLDNFHSDGQSNEIIKIKEGAIKSLAELYAKQGYVFAFARIFTLELFVLKNEKFSICVLIIFIQQNTTIEFFIG